MLYTYHLTTPVTGFVSITAQVKGAVAESGVQSGICVVYCPHTTAGITINENADPDVQRDLLLAYAEAFPDRKAFRHAEGNSAAHFAGTDNGDVTDANYNKNTNTTCPASSSVPVKL